MVDWSGHEERDTAARYREMGERQTVGVSPSYTALCLGVAADADLLERLDTLPRPKRQPNLLLGAVRFLGGPVDTYPAFRAFVLAGWDDLAATMRDRRTQTNEPRRCATLLPALARIDGPLALLEVGASAGLCLYPDRYGYRYDGAEVLGDGAVVFDCATSGPVPVPTRLPDVVWRRGLDLNPLDVSDDEDVRWLEALVWPEQTERFATLRGAVQVARAEPPEIVRGDLLTHLAAVAADAPVDATLVVFHSAVLSYLDAAGRTAFAAEVLALGRDVVWVANEGPGIVTTAPGRAGPTPFVLAVDSEAVAFTAPHGEWIEWLG